MVSTDWESGELVPCCVGLRCLLVGMHLSKSSGTEEGFLASSVLTLLLLGALLLPSSVSGLLLGSLPQLS